MSSSYNQIYCKRPKPGEVKAALDEKLTPEELAEMPAIIARLKARGLISFKAGIPADPDHKKKP